MAADVPGIKRAGLPVDLDRLTAEGDDWLSAEERYALKAHGVCAQTQPHVFMLRIRTGGGHLDTATARGLADLADELGKGWVHLTTRQQVELHHVAAQAVPTAIARVAALGLTTNTTCGHNVRGILSCPDAGVGLDEPFDCGPDAQAASALVVARGPELAASLPQRVNIGFGGCAACAEHARTNDVGFVSRVSADGALGYEVWLGGSLGKSMPTLGQRAIAFLPRAHVLPAVAALLEVFVTHGSFDKPNKARLKFLIRDLGWERFCALFTEALAAALDHPWPEPAPVAVSDPASAAVVLTAAPPGGWSSGVRPQRSPGLALVTVTVPMGDVDSDDLRVLADLADAVADGHLHLTRNQNVTLRDVPLATVPMVRARLAAVGLGLEDADQAVDVRACTGGPVCALAITPAMAAAQKLLALPALARHADLRVHVSGCMNSCAQQQIADIGFSGGKVRVGGQAVLGYQVWVGAGVGAGRLGQVAGRVAEADVPAVTEALIGLWEAVRRPGERFGDAVARIGLEAVQAHVEAVCQDRWASGPEPEPAAPVLPVRPVRQASLVAVGS